MTAQRDYSGPVFLAQGFRPFFMAAGLWAVLAMAIWLWEFNGGSILPSHLLQSIWHAHEMLFGYGAAVITGFLLTAIPNWTGRMPVRGVPLAGLALLWLAGRVSFILAVPSWQYLASGIEALYFVILCGFLIREIVFGKNWRNLVVVVLVGGLALANGLVHAELVGLVDSADLGIRLGIGLFVILITLIGGRVTPAFTKNWLTQRGEKNLPASLGLPDKIAVLATILAMGSWAILPYSPVSGWLIILAAAAQVFRLSRWQGFRCLSEPLILALHLGYGWLVIGLGLLGYAVLAESLPQSAALHGLTVGMIGTMTLAVMTRASLGHSGAALKADIATSLLLLTIMLAAITRVLAPLFGEQYLALLMLSGGLWIAAFALFVIRYLPLWIRA